MDPLDRRFAIAAFGVGVDVAVEHRCETGRCGQAGLADDVRALLPPGATDRSLGEAPAVTLHLVCAGDALTLSGHDGDDGPSVHDTAGLALHALDGAIRTAVALAAPGLVFIHAGVVELDGRAIVLPGRSMAGKTTLVATLVARGAGYLSDEYALLDEHGAVHPYPRRLSIRGAQGRREVPVAELGGRAVAGPVPVGLVAALRHRPDAEWSVAPGTGGECALALVDNAIAAQTRPGEVLASAAAVARQARFIAGERGEADAAVDRLLALCVG